MYLGASSAVILHSTLFICPKLILELRVLTLHVRTSSFDKCLVTGKSRTENFDSGGAIYCNDCPSFKLYSTTITGGRANQGGAIALIQSDNEKDSSI